MMYLLVHRGAVIRRKLRKIEPFQPIIFAQRAQEMFVEVNSAIQRQENTLCIHLSSVLCALLPLSLVPQKGQVGSSSFDH